MATCISHSAAETAALGETWGREAELGTVIGLCGDLGAGKTQLVKGLARGLGITDRVRSPTFALVNIYGGGRLPLFHLDLYRLDTREQIVAAGLEEYLNPAGVTVIEWAERWFEVGSLQSTDHGPRTTDHGPRTADHGPRTTDHGPRTTDHGPRTTDHRPRTTDHGPRTTDHGPRTILTRLRWVHIDVLSEGERRITYEDTNA